MKGLVLAGGHGTRLRPLTFSGNKHMLPIANQPILFYGLRHLARAGIRDVAIILGPIHEGIRESIGDGSGFGLRIEYIFQGEPRGLADAVICAKEFLSDDSFLMYLGDNLLQSGVEPFLERFKTDNPDAVVGATQVAHPEAYGVIEVRDGRIVSLEEKPSHPRSDHALVGIYLFSKEIHPIIKRLRPSQRGELEITEAIWNLWETRHRVSVLDLTGWWKDTGKPEDLLDANELVLRTMPPGSFQVQGRIQEGAKLEGPVAVGPDSVIERGAIVVGPTVIGAHVLVSQGSSVGPGCAIGDLASVVRSEVRHSIVMEGARLEGVRLTSSLVGRGTSVSSRRTCAEPAILVLGDSSKVTL